MQIRVETSSGMPISRQIAAQLRAQCASGRLRAGDRLPSVRALAAELAVNQNTILRVYERLSVEGLLERRQGDGTFVAQRVPGGQMQSQRRRLRQDIARVAELAKTLGVDREEIRRWMDEAFDLPLNIAQEKPPAAATLKNPDPLPQPFNSHPS